jgi:hypothetical protein
MPDGKAIASMYKEQSRIQDKILDFASKLAPYEAPRLESIDTKEVVEYQFVVFGKHRAQSFEEWLENCKSDSQLIEADYRKNG